jgi:hypothetical protein
MAPNYQSLDFSSCLDRLTVLTPNVSEPNACVPWPSSFNPYNVTTLPGFTLEMLSEILSNPAFGHDANLCFSVVQLLPKNFPGIRSVIEDPRTLNLPVLSLHLLGQHTLPDPVNRTTDPIEILDWWWGNVVNNTGRTSDFLRNVTQSCTFAICRTIGDIGDKDIIGIGMLVSTDMLIILAILFGLPALFAWTAEPPPAPVTKEASDGPASRPKVRWLTRIQTALVGTLDDLLGAILIFTLSVLVSSIVYRFTELTVYNKFMAETLSLVCATAMVMVGAAHWRHGRLRVAMFVGYWLNAVLTIVLFATDFYSQARGLDEGLPLERNCLRSVLTPEAPPGALPDLNDLGSKRKYYPACFALWCVALLGSMAQLPRVRGGWLARQKRAVLLVVDAVPFVAGTATMIWLIGLFWKTYEDMTQAYGEAFTTNEKEWGFGQILALATWIPPILTFGHQLIGKYSSAPG